MNYMPDRKVLAGGLSGLAAWGLGLAAAHFGIVIPPEALTMLVGFAITGVAYVVPPSVKDITKRLNDDIVAIAAADPSVPVTPAKPAVISTITNAARRAAPSLVLFAMLGAVLAGCQTTGQGSSPNALQQAVQNVESMTPEQKYDVACQTADALHLTYLTFVAEKQSASTNAKEKAAYAGILQVCQNRPTNYATGLVTLVSALNAFKASMAGSGS